MLVPLQNSLLRLGGELGQLTPQVLPTAVGVEPTKAFAITGSRPSGAISAKPHTPHQALLYPSFQQLLHLWVGHVKAPIDQYIKSNVGPTSLPHLPSHWAPWAREKIHKQLSLFPSGASKLFFSQFFQPLGDSGSANGWNLRKDLVDGFARRWGGSRLDTSGSLAYLCCFYPLAGFAVLVSIPCTLGANGCLHVSLERRAPTWQGGGCRRKR